MENYELKEKLFIYLAGLFDGEGSAGIYLINRHNDRGYKYKARTPQVSVRMCDAEPVLAFVEAFGGKVYLTKPPAPRKHVFSWTRQYRKALAVAEALLPYTRNQRQRNKFLAIIEHYS